jgi:uncharacterized protein YkwD
MGRLTVALPVAVPACRRAALAFVAVLALGAGAASAQPKDLEDLRQRALELTNGSRAENGLPPLSLTDVLNEAALAHAQDMAERDFYAHVGPDGGTPRDRFLDAGGSRWKLAAENIARCTGCAPPPDEARVESFHSGWMDSPGHRANILSEGLDGFGFAIVADGDVSYAVQTFSGAGTPPGLEDGEASAALAPAERSVLAVDRINRARERAGAAELSASDALGDVAAELIAGGSGDRIIDNTADLFASLPAGERGRWTGLQVIAAACGGCGSAATAADVRRFVRQWLDDAGDEESLLAPDADALGFALEADGEGRKVAVAVIGERR